MMRVNTANGWLDVRFERQGIWEIMGNSATSGTDPLRDCINLGYSPKGEDVIDLDDGRSEESQYFGISGHIRVDGKVDLVGRRILANSEQEMVESLTKVTLLAWCPGDL